MPDLSDYLIDIGLEVLRVDGDEINAVCPAHVERVGHPDSHPSFGFNMAKGVGNCFSCSWHPTFNDLVIWLTGTPPPQDLVEQTKTAALTKAVQRLTEEKREALVDFTIHEWTLSNRFVDVKRVLLERRNLDLEAVNVYGIRFDPINRTWVMPIRDHKGRLMGWQRKAGGIKAYNEPKELEKSQYLFGLHAMRMHDRLAVVESPLDAVRLYQAGIPAVSSMGAFISDTQCRLLSRHTAVTVLALDNDDAGRAGTKQAIQRLRNTGTAVLVWGYDGTWKANAWKDPGDCPDDRILKRTWQDTLRLGL